jgi:hypothetical protein
MKNINLSKLIKQLAEEFSSEFNNLPITVLPNGDIVYQEYLIKQEPAGNWGVYSIQSTDLKCQFFLKSCALLAAHYYENHEFHNIGDIRQLDRDYWRNHSDTLIYKKHLKDTQDIDRKSILLTRLECSESDADYFKRRISRLFKRSFV